ncbi:hypothetical protein [Rhizobacter sp. Root1221]|uniref:hypothetical protein n=1 Tax=Rhizobacter sp. Root1221 TaxID=1736433 RepID=UPI0006F97A25|nr:hypothetical protein [Rhizobacter sp. Root1221]KQV93397.1 hypothetical protein ASC87_27215 [Rhizobacter sp. Root1221]
MLRLIATLLMLAVSCVSHAEPVLLGTWKSDKQRTLAFAQARTKLEHKTFLFLEQIMGQMTLTISKDTITSRMPDVPIESADGVKSNFVGSVESHPYKRLGGTQTEIAVLTKEPFTGRDSIVVHHFVDSDTMWIYVAGTAMPNLHIREYFVRVK